MIAPDDQRDWTNTTVIVVVGPRDSTATWEAPDWSAINKQCEYPEQTYIDWVPRIRIPTHLIVRNWIRWTYWEQRDTRFKRPPQQASAYG